MRNHREPGDVTHFGDPSAVLPAELFLKMCEHLDAASLMAASVTSQSWRQICLDPQLWKRIYLGEKLGCIPKMRSKERKGTLFDTQQEPNWLSLYKQRKTVQQNWAQGRSTDFCLPQKDFTSEGHTDQILCLQMSSSWLVSGSRDRTIRRWNLDTLRLRGSPLYGHSGEIQALQYHTHRDLLVSGCSDATLIFWRLSSGTLMSKFDCVHESAISSICLADETVLTGAQDGVIRIWSKVFRQGHEQGEAQKDSLKLLESLIGHTGPISSIDISNEYIASCSQDRTTRLWNPLSGQCLRILDDQNGFASMNLNGRFTISGARPGKINILDDKTGRVKAVLYSSYHLVNTIQALSDDSAIVRVVSGSHDGKVMIWTQVSSMEWMPSQHMQPAYVTCPNLGHTPKYSSISSRLHEPSRSVKRTHYGDDTAVSCKSQRRTTSGACFHSPNNVKGTEASPNTGRRSVRGRTGDFCTTGNTDFILRKIQSDETRIVCCGNSQTIFGWDFVNGDSGIQQDRKWLSAASRAFLQVQDRVASGSSDGKTRLGKLPRLRKLYDVVA